MKKLLTFIILLMILLLTSCSYTIINKGITNFEDFNEKEHLNETFTFTGEAIYFPYKATENRVGIHGLEDSEGFNIKFIPRGGRSIETGRKYTIIGTIIIEEDRGCIRSLRGNDCDIYLIQEIKPN